MGQTQAPARHVPVTSFSALLHPKSSTHSVATPPGSCHNCVSLGLEDAATTGVRLLRVFGHVFHTEYGRALAASADNWAKAMDASGMPVFGILIQGS